MEKIVVENDFDTRLDSYLAIKLDISRSKIQKLIKDEKILVNEKAVSASYKEEVSKGGFTVEFNGEAFDCISAVYNDTHYVPLRKVFEKMGAHVFYRGRDRMILALSRDGDVIRHIVGGNIITVNL